MKRFADFAEPSPKPDRYWRGWFDGVLVGSGVVVGWVMWFEAYYP